MASGELSAAVFVKSPASNGRSTRTTRVIVVPGVTSVKRQFSVGTPSAVGSQPPPALPPAATLTLTVAGGVR